MLKVNHYLLKIKFFIADKWCQTVLRGEVESGRNKAKPRNCREQ